MDSARWVRVEHEHFIPLAPSALCDVLRAELQGTKAEKDVKRFTTIVQLLEMLIRMQYYPLTETLKRSYDIFDPARAAHSTVQLSPDEIKAREGTAHAAGLPARGTSRDALSLTHTHAYPTEEFLASFLTVMQRANFTLLSAQGARKIE